MRLQIKPLRRYLAYKWTSISSLTYTTYLKRKNPSAKLEFDGTPEFQAYMTESLELLGTRWAYGRSLVERYVWLVIQMRITDRHGFINGVWMYSPDLVKTERAEVALRLVRMAVLRRAWLINGWRSFVWNESFLTVGERMLKNGARKMA